MLISHDMDVVRRYAKRAIVLKDGDLVYDGTPTELFGGAYAVEEWGLRRPTAADWRAVWVLRRRHPRSSAACWCGRS